MKTQPNNGFLIFIRLFISGLILFTLIKIINNIIRIVFEINKIQSFNQWTLLEIVTTSFLLSLFTFSNYQHTAKAIRMDDKTKYTEVVIRTLNRMKWRIDIQGDDEIIFVSPFLYGIWQDKIIVRFTTTELQIGGPREYIEKVIRLSKFPYGSFEINNF